VGPLEASMPAACLPLAVRRPWSRAPAVSTRCPLSLLREPGGVCYRGGRAGPVRRGSRAEVRGSRRSPASRCALGCSMSYPARGTAQRGAGAPLAGMRPRSRPRGAGGSVPRARLRGQIPVQARAPLPPSDAPRFSGDRRQSDCCQPPTRCPLRYHDVVQRRSSWFARAGHLDL